MNCNRLSKSEIALHLPLGLSNKNYICMNIFIEILHKFQRKDQLSFFLAKNYPLKQFTIFRDTFTTERTIVTTTLFCVISVYTYKL